MSDHLVIKCAHGHRAEAGEAAYTELQAEVQSSRKLLDAILALHTLAVTSDEDYRRCAECWESHPCPTVRLIENHRNPPKVSNG